MKEHGRQRKPHVLKAQRRQVNLWNLGVWCRGTCRGRRRAVREFCAEGNEEPLNGSPRESYTRRRP